MKQILVLTLAFNLMTVSAIAAVKEDVIQLASLAMGHRVNVARGKTHQEVLTHFFEAETGEAEMTFKEFGDMDYGDEVDYGFTSTASAIKMGDFAIGFLEEQIQNYEDMGDEADQRRVKEMKAQIFDIEKKWAGLIKKLEKQGVKFGYSGFGPGYCGVSFVELLIIDEKEDKVYEVFLSESGEC